jgi:membrane protein implicated in regulation of membrane protease activity
MKNPKRLAIVLLTGFLAFAPPGTMIFLSALVVGLIGGRWAAAVAVCVGAGIAFYLLRRRGVASRLRRTDDAWHLRRTNDERHEHRERD